MSNQNVEDERRTTAYHEAGHGVAYWFEGMGDAVDYLRLGGKTDDSVGVLQLRSGSPPQQIGMAVALGDRKLLCENKDLVAASLTCIYSGPAAEYRHTLEKPPSDAAGLRRELLAWRGNMMNTYYEVFDDDPPIFPDYSSMWGDTSDYGDLSDAIAVAVALLGKTPLEVKSYLGQREQDAAKLICDAHFWRCVEAVATRLLDCESMLGQEMCQTIEKALGKKPRTKLWSKCRALRV